jgi:hypothetical protein
LHAAARGNTGAAVRLLAAVLVLTALALVWALATFLDET